MFLYSIKCFGALPISFPMKVISCRPLWAEHLCRYEQVLYMLQAELDYTALLDNL